MTLGWMHFAITRLRREAHAWDADIAEHWYISLRDARLGGVTPRVGDRVSILVVDPDPPGAPLRQREQREVRMVTLGELVIYDQRDVKGARRESKVSGQ